MTKDRNILNIPQASKDSALSKSQKQFNNLVKKIEAKKQTLVEWGDTIPKFNEKISTYLIPQFEKFNNIREDLICLFDAVYDNKIFTKTDKAKISHIIVTTSSELIELHGMDELKELHDRYSDRGYDELEQEETLFKGEFVKSMMSNVLGMDIDHNMEFDSPESLEAFVSQKMQELRDQEQEQFLKSEEKRAKRKKTPKQLEKELKLQEAEQEISQSIREVFRKLTSNLHPDREQDPDERERKTLLMQRVNAAYAKKDLLALLELQLEIEQIDQDHLNNISEEKLKFFIKILKDQLHEIEHEILVLEQPYRVQFNIPPYATVTTKQLQQKLDFDIEHINQEILEMSADLEMFKDPKNIKAWLKGYKIPKQQDLYDDFGMLPPFL